MTLTTTQLADLTGIPPATLRKWVERGRLHPVRRGTRPLVFSDTTVEQVQQARWRDEQRAAAAWIGPVVAEFDEQVAADLRRVSRCGHAQPSPVPVEG